MMRTPTVHLSVYLPLLAMTLAHFVFWATSLNHLSESILLPTDWIACQSLLKCHNDMAMGVDGDVGCVHCQRELIRNIKHNIKFCESVCKHKLAVSISFTRPSPSPHVCCACVVLVHQIHIDRHQTSEANQKRKLFIKILLFCTQLLLKRKLKAKGWRQRTTTLMMRMTTMMWNSIFKSNDERQASLSWHDVATTMNNVRQYCHRS